MAQTIAFAGKGGTGKTTIAGLLIDRLTHEGKGPILAVDADPNSNLNEVLGVEAGQTLGEIREAIAHAELDGASTLPTGVSKQDYAEFSFGDALLEAGSYDLLVMGRTQGQGCYCYVNGLLKTLIAKYARDYEYIVVDNEAGLEHISRGILPKMDVLLLVSDCSRRGVQAAGRLGVMADELGLRPQTVGLIINRAPGSLREDLDPGIREEIALQKLGCIGVVPSDETVYHYDAEGRPTVSLPSDNPVRRAVDAIGKKLGL
ncbi:MAG: AAA family ATPase [Coriobacteriales bacterium]|jgi:CO dehydrogenase maturation factor|nr:AAA family ATPase [Coriobacteriales bacterium]